MVPGFRRRRRSLWRDQLIFKSFSCLTQPVPLENMTKAYVLPASSVLFSITVPNDPGLIENIAFAADSTSASLSH